MRDIHAFDILLHGRYLEVVTGLRVTHLEINIRRKISHFMQLFC